MALTDHLRPAIHIERSDPTATAGAVLKDIAVQSNSWICWRDSTDDSWHACPASAAIPRLRAADATSAATDVLTGVLLLIPHAETDDVDSVFRAKRVLSDHGARALLLLRNGKPVGVFEVATASASEPTQSSPRQWITDMPDDETLFRSRVMFMDTKPKLQTRIVPDASLDHSVSIMLAASELADRKVQFRVSGTNVNVLDQSGASGAEAWSEFVDPLSDDASFEVWLSPLAVGEALVELELVFDDDRVTGLDPLRFAVLPDPTAKIPEPSWNAAETTPFSAPPAASVSMAWKDEDSYQMRWRHDGTDREHPIAADKGAIEGRELVELRERIEALAHQYQANDIDVMQLQNSGEALLAFAQLGADLHAFVFGRDQYDVDETTFDRAREIASIGRRCSGHRLTVHDDHVGIPWGLMYDAGYGEPQTAYPKTIQDVQTEGFWGYRFRIDYQVARGRVGFNEEQHVLTRSQPSLVPFVNTSIVPENPEVSAELVEMNDALLASQADRVSQAKRSTDIVSWISANEPSDVIYIFGHGEAAVYRNERGLPERVGRDEQAQLTIGIEPVSIKDLQAAEPKPPTLNGSPLIFLNACETLEKDLFYSNPFVNLFYKRWEARTVIGGVASLPGRFAVGFAQRFFDGFLSSSEQAGAVLYKTVRELLDEENPYGLLYALYGRSELQIRKAQ